MKIEHTRPGCYRFFKVTDYLYVLVLIAHILLIPLMLALSAYIVARYNIISILLLFSCIILNRKGWHGIAFFLIFIEINIHAYVTTHYLGWESGFYLYTLFLAPLIFFNPIWSLELKIFSSSLLVISFTVLFNNYHEMLYGSILYSNDIGHSLFLVNTIFTVIFYSTTGYYYNQAANDSEEKLHKALQEAEWLAHTDPLTHIGNRRVMTNEIKREASRVKRSRRSFLIALCDIDNFKSLNDDYGHDYGDHILISVATELNDNIRHHDRVARWGGGQFMILLPDTHPDEGMTIINRLRQQLSENKYYFKGKEHPGITLTFGLCLFDNSLEIKDCIDSADQALYQGKSQGKNRTVMFNNPAYDGEDHSTA